MRPQCADALTPYLSLFYELRTLKVGEMFRDCLLGDMKGLRKLGDTRRTSCKSSEHEPSRGIRQGNKRGAECIHNYMVVDRSQCVKPDVLAGTANSEMDA